MTKINLPLWYIENDKIDLFFRDNMAKKIEQSEYKGNSLRTDRLKKTLSKSLENRFNEFSKQRNRIKFYEKN